MTVDHDQVLYCLKLFKLGFKLVFTAKQDYFTHSGKSQSFDGAKMRDP